MVLFAIFGGLLGAIFGLGLGVVLFDSIGLGLGLAVAFAAGIGGILYTIASERDY